MPILKIIFNTFSLAAFLVAGTSLNAQNPAIKPGAAAPFIKLKNIDNRVVSLLDYPMAKGFIIVFISNTCPYSKAYEQRIIDLDKKYSSLHIPVIAINSNDPVLSPGDNFKEMQQRAKAAHYPFAYLCDDQQQVADLYGARSTPQVFIISKMDSSYTVEYTGTIDNDSQNKNPDKIRYAEDAVIALLHNTKPAVTETRAIGCRISRRKK